MNLNIEYKTSNEMTEAVRKLEDIIKTLKNYILMPDDNAEKLANSNLSINNEFKEICVGLKGELTKKRSIEIGKEVLIKYYKEVLGNVIDLYSTYVKTWEDNKANIFDRMDTYIGKYSFEELDNLKEAYNSSDITKRTMLLKLNNSFIRDFNKAYNCNKNLREALYTIYTTLNELTIIDIDSNDIKTKIDKYFASHSYIKYMLAKVGTEGFAAEYDIHQVLDNTGELIELDSMEYVSKLIGDTFNKNVDTNNFSNDLTELDVLDKIISDLEIVYDRIITAIKSIGEIISVINTNDGLFIDLLNRMDKDQVDPYLDGTYTAIEFVAMNKEMFKLINDSVNTEISLQLYLTTVYKTLKLKLNAFNDLYSLIDNVVKKATILK